MDSVNAILGNINNYLYGYVLVYLLVAVGLGLTIYLGGVQFRHIGAIFTSMRGSRGGSEGGISSFQAFSVGLATRVGIGNIGGVALALIVGGPGSIFWMWIVALLGMATAFSESTLAQVFKVRHVDGTYRGGPAYYISRGMGWKKIGALFAVLTILSSGLAVPMVQINTVAATFKETQGVAPWVTALVVILLLAPAVLGGVRIIARISEILAPIMAVFYLSLTVIVIVMNVPAAWEALQLIVASAFGYGQVAGGVAGGIFTAMLNGARRGLFSNEAGLGTSPNAAGSATVAHPVQQGLIQALGVFIDTIIICTATALLILIAGEQVYQPGVTTDPAAAGSLTAQAVIHMFGPWMALPMALVVFVFGFSSAFGAYSYGLVSLDHLTDSRMVSIVFRVVALIVASSGALWTLSTVWALSDISLGLGAIINLVALVALGKWVRALLVDWRETRNDGGVFVGEDNPRLPGNVPGLVWGKRRY